MQEVADSGPKTDSGGARGRPVAPLSILASMLEQLVADAAHQPQLDPRFSSTLRKAQALACGLERYVEACSTTESPELASLTADTHAEDWAGRLAAGETTLHLEPEMLSGPVEGQFLKLLVYAMRAERVLEIGMFTGYSALAMAEALPEHGRLVACEFDAFAANVARRAFARSQHGGKISIELGGATESLRRLAAKGERFDIVFIDADKGGYVEYYNAILDLSLLAPNGLICVDNTLMQGQPYLPGASTANGQAIAHFNRIVADDPRVEQVMLPLRDGLTMIRRVDPNSSATDTASSDERPPHDG